MEMSLVVVVPFAATVAATVDPHQHSGAQTGCAYVARTVPIGTNSGEGGFNFIKHESLNN